MSDWLLFVIASLAVYRVARIIAEEDGPNFVFKKIRLKYADQQRAFDVGIRCFYCVSTWVALPAAVALVLLARWEIWLWPLWWFGIAGAAAKWYEYWGKR